MVVRNLIAFILMLFFFETSLGQAKDSIGINNNPVITRQESAFINAQLKEVKQDTFDFTNKTVAFYYSLTGYKQKQDYFKDAKQYRSKGQPMLLQILVLDENEKKETHGYDAIVVAWYRQAIMRDARAEIVKKLKKESH